MLGRIKNHGWLAYTAMLACMLTGAAHAERNQQRPEVAREAGGHALVDVVF